MRSGMSTSLMVVFSSSIELSKIERCLFLKGEFLSAIIAFNSARDVPSSWFLLNDLAMKSTILLISQTIGLHIW